MFHAKLAKHAKKTSYLPAMTSRMSEELTGNVRAKRILSDLSRQNLFTVRLQRSPVQYQYHPLFTDYLRAHVREYFTAEDLSALEIDAARILAGSGQIEEAVGFLLDAQAWEKAVELIWIDELKRLLNEDFAKPSILTGSQKVQAGLVAPRKAKSAVFAFLTNQ